MIKNKTNKALLIWTILIAVIIPMNSQNKVQLHDKKFSNEIEAERNEGKLSESSAAYHYTYIGNYQKAIETFSLPLDWGLDTLSYSDSLKFQDFIPTNAFDYIGEKSKSEQIVIISEAHQMPQHRLFTTRLLKKFYANGFRHLGLETLTPNYIDSTKFLMDTLLNERGYPLNSPLTGTFTREPQMGDLVSEAINIGFKVFAYERTDRRIERDLQQAINIEKYINAHQNEKIVIHCGWYHAIESDFTKNENDNWMAYHLKKRTDINPLTIYQDALSERYTSETNSPYYNMIKSDEVSVLIKDGEVFNGFDEKNHFDVMIYHPPTKYIKNRPNWALGEGKKFVSVDKDQLEIDDYPIIVEAINSNQYNGVPCDVIELLDENDITELILNKGDFRIKLTNSLKEVIEYKLKLE